MLKRPLKDYEKLFLNSMFDVIVASLQVKAHFTERTNFKAAGTWAYEKKASAALAALRRLSVLPFVLLLANSKRIVWGMSGSKRTPCCKFYLIMYMKNKLTFFCCNCFHSIQVFNDKNAFLFWIGEQKKRLRLKIFFSVKVSWILLQPYSLCLICKNF